MNDSKRLSRRHLLASTAGLLGSAGALSLTPRLAVGAANSGGTKSDIDVPQNGRNYDRVPLRQDFITISAVQSRVRAVDGSNPDKGMRENLDYMLELIDKAQFYTGKKDLVCFHEFPIQGWYPWDRKEVERMAIEIPGPQTEEISAKAKKYGCYIQFGAYAKDKDWPGHILSVTTIIGPQGQIIARDWKARNIKGVFPGFELFTTTVYNVLDQYIEMYGADAVIPVHRTDIGNLSSSSAQREPELFRAMALKGAEIFLRTATGGFQEADMQMCAAYNGVYSTVCNNSASPDNPGFMADALGGAGGTAIYGPQGEVVAKATSKFEQQAIARIPIAEFRAHRMIPDVHMPLYLPVFEKYHARFAPGLFSSYDPTGLQDAKRYLDGKDRWR